MNIDLSFDFVFSPDCKKINAPLPSDIGNVTFIVLRIQGVNKSVPSKHKPAGHIMIITEIPLLFQKKYRARQEISCLALSGTFRHFPRVGQRVSLEGTSKIKHLKKLRIMKENHRNQAIPVIFGGDYWTRTSGLMRVKIR